MESSEILDLVKVAYFLFIQTLESTCQSNNAPDSLNDQQKGCLENNMSNNSKTLFWLIAYKESIKVYLWMYSLVWLATLIINSEKNEI